MDSVLVLVADKARARLFRSDNRIGPLEEFEDLANPESRLHEGDLITDAPGMMKSRMASNDMRSTYPENTKRDHSANLFAGSVSKAMEKAVETLHPSRIHVIASPEFLGYLRDKWTKPVQSLITEETAKDISKFSLEEIREHLPDLI